MPQWRRPASRGHVRLLIVAMLSAAAMPAARAGSTASASPASALVSQAVAGRPAAERTGAGGGARGEARRKAPAGRAAAKTADDGGLFEFLGGIGAENERWIDYLAKTAPGKVAPVRDPPTARNVASARSLAVTRDPPPVSGSHSDEVSDGSQKR
jgi:hypothetical protein